MSYRKSKKNSSFTVVYNEVAQHEVMSMEARGLQKTDQISKKHQFSDLMRKIKENQKK